ncbi:MAG TPA: sugar phosphate isomerase/epimerase [Candidatus Brocadiia bacterium]|nr:sugar phosphate isomerase/epimerase [Candidatus Brocadiia bacterium]
MSELKFAFMASLGFGSMPAREVVKILKGIGYDGVEWTLAHFNPRAMKPAQLAEVVAVTRSGGLEPSELVVQQDVVTRDENARADRVRLVAECIQAGAEHGIKTMNLFTGPAPWDPGAPVVGKNITMGEAWRMVFEAYDRWVPEAERLGVNLAVEGVFGMLAHDFYTTRFLIEHYNSSSLGVNFDPSHDVLYGNTDSGWMARQWGDRIKHVHLKDAVGIPEMGRFLFPLLGEGNVDWKGFFTALRDMRYGGFCSVEFESFGYISKVMKGDVVAAARMSMEQIRALLP